VPIVCENYAHIYYSKAKRFNAGEIVVRGAFALPLMLVVVTSGTG